MAASTSGNPCVFFEISIAGEPKGRILMVLFASEVPQTAENFRALCAGEKKPPLQFKGTAFHRIVPDFMCCGGNLVDDKGWSIGTIYGAKFPVVEKSAAHRTFMLPGVLCTAHAVPSNSQQAPYACSSQFFITTAATPWLSNHTIFGKVVEGMHVVRAMEQEGTRNGTPKRRVEITFCGELPSSRLSGRFPRRGR